jgi:mRNA interferase MazF
MPRQSWVKISQIRVLAVERLGPLLGEASHEELTQVIDGVSEIIGD